MIVMKVILRLVMIIIFIFTHALPFNEKNRGEKTLKRIKKSSMNIFSSILNWRKIRHVTMV